ncbi:phytoene desaturase [Methanoculleus sp. FWC-SCC1]|uniref:Phytoene desaturase n=1 Tax=Methanoculleus frigidifontis TaxID=2584085 RepID=A0ABT8MA15_9EURY|nr:phytoene desaturase family protein [Methanoculleus sp. FWC-SCC1]MDN7024777.1 phytoene desaturase [Methanoculleus sp. FWC-SCC1]
MRVVVVGAGFGGLSIAVLLAKNGFDVTVIEKNEQPGGRASVYSENGFTFDMGPSWYLMPDVFERFFAELDRRPEDFFRLIRLDPSYRVFFGDEKAVDVSADLEDNYALFESFEPGGAEKLKGYLRESEEKYDLTMGSLLYRDYRTVLDFLDGRLLLEGMKLHLFENLETFVQNHFESDEARKIVQYSIGFLGGSPQNTPSFYHIMTHIDMNLGVWYPEGGIRAVVQGLISLGRELGVEYRYNEPVTAINVEHKTARHVVTPAGSYDTDIVVVNADYPFTELRLLGEDARSYSASYWEKKILAPSAFVAYLGVNREIGGLVHHNLFLEPDWEESFETIFDPEKAAWPSHPSFYVNVPSRTDTTAAPEGTDTLFVLAPLAPGLEDTPALRDRFYNLLMDRMEEILGEEIRDAVVVKRIFALSDFAQRYNAYKGTALGLTHTLWQTALWRPAHRSKRAGNLYYTGQYTHPGIGVPMTLISSQLVARELTERYQ